MGKTLPVVVAILLLSSLSAAQTFSHRQATVSAGGGVAVSGNFTNRAVIAQTAAGRVSAGVFTNTAGFLGKSGWVSSVDEKINLPSRVELLQNYPNPFNPTTTIRYFLPEAAPVSIEVYNLLGQRVAALENGLKAAGYHSVVWDPGELASGVYIYRLRVGGVIESKRMLLLK